MKVSPIALGVLNYLTIAIYTMVTIISNRKAAFTDFAADIAILLLCLNICALLINKIMAECICDAGNGSKCSREIDLTVDGDEELRKILKDAQSEDVEMFNEIKLDEINNIN